MYEDLIKVLRCELYGDDECDRSDCPIWSSLGCRNGIANRAAAAALEAADRRIKELESQAAFFDAEKLNYQENIEYRDERIKELEAQIPKEGEWIKHGCEEDEFTYWECPYCGFIGLDYRYCPNCGARMRGANDE